MGLSLPSTRNPFFVRTCLSDCSPQRDSFRLPLALYPTEAKRPRQAEGHGVPPGDLAEPGALLTVSQASLEVGDGSGHSTPPPV